MTSGRGAVLEEVLMASAERAGAVDRTGAVLDEVFRERERFRGASAERIREELIQVAAVAVAMVEAIDRAAPLEAARRASAAIQAAGRSL